jgi:hypothetical protein
VRHYSQRRVYTKLGGWVVATSCLPEIEQSAGAPNLARPEVAIESLNHERAQCPPSIPRERGEYRGTKYDAS